MTLTSRLKQLEKKAGTHDKYKYMCVIRTGWAVGWDSEAERAKGYKIQPYMQSAGGTGGEPFYVATLAELYQFSERPDVDIKIIIVGDQEGQDEFTRLFGKAVEISTGE